MIFNFFELYIREYTRVLSIPYETIHVCKTLNLYEPIKKLILLISRLLSKISVNQDVMGKISFHICIQKEKS